MPKKWMAPGPERPELVTSSPVSYSLHTLWCFSRPQETKHTCWGARSLTYNRKFRYYISSSHTHTHTSRYSAWHSSLYNYYFKAMCLWYNYNLSFFFFPFLNTGPPETLCGLWPRILHATLFFFFFIGKVIDGIFTTLCTQCLLPPRRGESVHCITTKQSLYNLFFGG